MNRMLLGFALATFAGSAQADKIDDYIKTAMERDHIPGVCVAVIPPGDAADIRGYGFANLEAMTPFNRTSVFRVASLSKQFCAYAVLSLIKQGKLSPNDTLLKFFPKGHKDWGKINIGHVLAHRSGIADPGTAFNYKNEYTTESYVELLSRAPLAEEPGSTYRYNNHGYSLLGLIVGQVSDSSLESYVKKSIFEPLQMTSARYYRLDEVIPNRAEGYRWGDDKYVRPLMIRPLVFAGSGGILMSMDDIVKYEIGLRKEEALDREILHQQRKTYDKNERGYGAGWFISKVDGKQVMTHTGGTFGFTCAYLREVDEGWTAIVFRNSEGGDAMQYARDILKLSKEKALAVSYSRAR